MEITALTVLDQLRYLIGLLAACFLFFHHAAVPRPRFALRVTLGCGAALLLALAYLVIGPVLAELPTLPRMLLFGVYWLGMSFFVCFVPWFCYQVTPGETLFRGLLGCSLEGMTMAVVRYLIAGFLFPTLEAEHTALYLVVMVAVYLLLYGMTYTLFAKGMQSGTNPALLNTSSAVPTFCVLMLCFSLLTDVAKFIFEWVLPSYADYTEYLFQYSFTRFFCILMLFVFCLVTLILLNLLYRMGTLQSEMLLLDEILQEKAEQYQRSRENIDLINRKCHDLKHQLLALEVAGTEERQAIIDETKKAVMFYDSTVKTGNEVLDTLLTEKSTLCTDRNIRLSCTVSAPHLNQIGVVDLYTMLGNAIDNAIECVSAFSEDGKKTISLTVREYGSMLCFSVENYYEQPIQMKGKYPVTSKGDRRNHGIGVRSIDLVAQRYGGSTRISTEHQIFLLQIMIPLSKLH